MKSDMIETTRLMLWAKLKAQLKSKKVTLDLNGHFVGGKKLDDFYFDTRLWTLFIGIPQPDVWYIDKVLSKPTNGENGRFRSLNNNIIICDQCDQPLILETNGTVLRAANPCPYPDGLPPFEFELNVPSGKMVVGNDFRKWFRVIGQLKEKSQFASYQITKKYEDVGLAHAYIGNSCPNLYRMSDGSFAIGCNKYNTRFWKDNKWQTPADLLPIKGSKIIGEILTELHWYSIADFDEFVLRAGRDQDGGEKVISCKPGVYLFRHHYHQVATEAGARIFTTIDWTREPEKPRPYLDEWNAMNCSAEQIIASKVRLVNNDAIAQAVGEIFCDDNDPDCHHPNGWIAHSPEIVDVKMHIPVFSKKYPWRLGRKSTMLVAAGISEEREDLKLNRSFLALAFNMLRCIIMNGVDDCNSRRTARTMDLASRCLFGLAKRYPKRIPKDCHQLLGIKDKAINIK